MLIINYLKPTLSDGRKSHCDYENYCSLKNSGHPEMKKALSCRTTLRAKAYGDESKSQKQS